MFVYKECVYCLNVGDSRAIVGSKIVDGNSSESDDHIDFTVNVFKSWTTEALSHDQTPEREDERKRILENGGCVKRQKD